MPQPDRRLFLRGAATLSAAAIDGLLAAPASGAPALMRAGRPVLTHGIQAGEVTSSGAVVWARADRPARMLVEVASTESFNNPSTFTGPVVAADSDFTGKLELDGLPAGERVFYRVTFADPDDPKTFSDPAVGSFTTAPDTAGDVRFVWGGDTAGQGWGINPDFGGFRTYEAMRQAEPDFFIHSGDTVYADGPLEPAVTLPDGSVWRNHMTPAKAKVAETLAEFRGNHQYNLTDANVRAFNAQVPVYAQWDDHEVTNNWYPGEVLDDDRYRIERRVDVLAARGRQAFFEYFPIAGDQVHRTVHRGPLLDIFFIDLRSFRGPNTTNDQPTPGPDTPILGARQLAWLKKALKESTATWKVIASDMPIGLVVPDGDTHFEAISQGRPELLGRELEIADLLRFIKHQRIANTVWITADVHYTAAHHYSPDRAVFQDFEPFWELVSGPLHAGTGTGSDLDRTFGPNVEFIKAAPDADHSAPVFGLQFFGQATIDGASKVLTVDLKDLTGATLHSVELQPQ